METLLHIQKRLIPDLLNVMQKRYQILQYIYVMQPVGRRSLAASLGITERVLRSEVDFLKKQNLLTVSSIGMKLTDDGKEMVEQLTSIMRLVIGLEEMAVELKRRLCVDEVFIVSGDSDESPLVKNELGQMCASILAANLHENDIIAVTGGTTMIAVAENLSTDFRKKQALFVPARGAIGEDVKNQANTICAKMAEVSGANYRSLYIPDQMSESLYQSAIHEPVIHEVLQLIHSASIVLHGIGDAKLMAERRNTKKEDMEKILKGHAAGEAFGYYFDKDGKIVHRVQTIGLQLEHLSRARIIIAVAGGTSKARAIQAYMKQAPESTVLITDEGAAKALLNEC